MNFQASKSIVLTVWLMLMALTACTQKPNYAPVKTVNQALEPDNGYIREKLPNNRPGDDTERQQQTTKPTDRRQEANPNQQDPIANRTPDLHQNNAQKNRTGQEVKKEAANVPTTSNKNTANKTQWVQQPIPLPYKVENPLKNKVVKQSVEKKPVPKQQKPILPKQELKGSLENQPIISNANKIKSQKNPKNIAVSIIISIDNEKVLKLNFQWPLQGKISRNFTQTDNKGIDIAGKPGQAVHAAEAGKAVYCGQGLAGFGNLVIIKHDETYLSAYANNSKLYIKEGQRLEKGQTIAQVGAAGLKKASLHFEIRKNGKPINPLTILPKH
ncbi:peptidoglycan DD-metalloendopeptidase family protein [Methyloglobulus sp.]|uniref:M23 family metallopeptidase n=1 Tax=Methyloglobulus sp. TaxID=2518622 RepID=UPI0032B78E42